MCQFPPDYHPGCHHAYTGPRAIILCRAALVRARARPCPDGSATPSGIPQTGPPSRSHSWDVADLCPACEAAKSGCKGKGRPSEGGGSASDDGDGNAAEFKKNERY